MWLWNCIPIICYFWGMVTLPWISKRCTCGDGAWFFHHGVCHTTGTEATDNMDCGQGTLRNGGTSKYSKWLCRNWYFDFKRPTISPSPHIPSPCNHPSHHGISPLLAPPLPTVQPSSTLMLPSLWSRYPPLSAALHHHCLLHIVSLQLGCHRGSSSSSWCPPCYCITSSLQPLPPPLFRLIVVY